MKLDHVRIKLNFALLVCVNVVNSNSLLSYLWLILIENSKRKFLNTSKSIRYLPPYFNCLICKSVEFRAIATGDSILFLDSRQMIQSNAYEPCCFYSDPTSVLRLLSQFEKKKWKWEERKRNNLPCVPIEWASSEKLSSNSVFL